MCKCCITYLLNLCSIRDLDPCKLVVYLWIELKHDSCWGYKLFSFLDSWFEFCRRSIIWKSVNSWFVICSSDAPHRIFIPVAKHAAIKCCIPSTGSAFFAPLCKKYMDQPTDMLTIISTNNWLGSSTDYFIQFWFILRFILNKGLFCWYMTIYLLQLVCYLCIFSRVPAPIVGPPPYSAV